MLPKNGREKWKQEEINRFKSEWCLARERSTPLKKDSICLLRKLEKETSMSLTTLANTLKYLFYVNNSSTITKSFLIMPWSCSIILKKYKATDRSCLANLLQRKCQIIIVILNLKFTKEPRNIKSKTWKTTQKFVKITKKMPSPELDKLKCPSAAQLQIRGLAQLKAKLIKNRKGLSMTECLPKSLWKMNNTVRIIMRLRGVRN